MAKTEFFTTEDGYEAIRYLEDDPDLGIASGSEFLVASTCHISHKESAMFTLVVIESDGNESEVRNASRAILEELGEFNLSIGARSYTITED